jgi:hypothetical protein
MQGIIGEVQSVSLAQLLLTDHAHVYRHRCSSVSYIGAHTVHLLNALREVDDSKRKAMLAPGRKGILFVGDSNLPRLHCVRRVMTGATLWTVLWPRMRQATHQA